MTCLLSLKAKVAGVYCTWVGWRERGGKADDRPTCFIPPSDTSPPTHHRSLLYAKVECNAL